jgi:hypothetical protein
MKMLHNTNDYPTFFPFTQTAGGGNIVAFGFIF